MPSDALKPCPAPAQRDLPHAITFFVSAGDRERILKKLRRYGPDRAAALRAALGLTRRSK